MQTIKLETILRALRETNQDTADEIAIEMIEQAAPHVAAKKQPENENMLAIKIIDILDESDPELIIELLDCLDQVENRATTQPARN